eukprot:scaffold50759_cov129-Isochrysis_galbana.AAC.2
MVTPSPGPVDTMSRAGLPSDSARMHRLWPALRQRARASPSARWCRERACGSSSTARYAFSRICIGPSASGTGPRHPDSNPPASTQNGRCGTCQVRLNGRAAAKSRRREGEARSAEDRTFRRQANAQNVGGKAPKREPWRHCSRAWLQISRSMRLRTTAVGATGQAGPRMGAAAGCAVSVAGLAERGCGAGGGAQHGKACMRESANAEGRLRLGWRLAACLARSRRWACSLLGVLGGSVRMSCRHVDRR